MNATQQELALLATAITKSYGWPTDVDGDRVRVLVTDAGRLELLEVSAADMRAAGWMVTVHYCD